MLEKFKNAFLSLKFKDINCNQIIFLKTFKEHKTTLLKAVPRLSFSSGYEMYYIDVF